MKKIKILSLSAFILFYFSFSSIAGNNNPQLSQDLTISIPILEYSSEGTVIEIPNVTLNHCPGVDGRLLFEYGSPAWNSYDSFENGELNPDLWDLTELKPNSDISSITVEEKGARFELKNSDARNKATLTFNVNNSKNIRGIKVKVFVESASGDVGWKINKSIGQSVWMQSSLKPSENYSHHEVTRCLDENCDDEETLAYAKFEESILIGKTVEMVAYFSTMETKAIIDGNNYSKSLPAVDVLEEDVPVTLYIKSNSGNGAGVFYLEEVSILK